MYDAANVPAGPTQITAPAGNALTPPEKRPPEIRTTSPETRLRVAVESAEIVWVGDAQAVSNASAKTAGAATLDSVPSRPTVMATIPNSPAHQGGYSDDHGGWWFGDDTIGYCTNTQ